MTTESLQAELTGSWDIRDFVETAHREGLAINIPTVEGANRAVINWRGQRLVNFASCSFLAMHTHPDVVGRFMSSAVHNGLATGGSRLVQGKMRPHVELEEAIARTTQKESVITYASGLLANLGFVNSLSKSTRITDELHWEADDVVFILDHDSHWSMWKAVEALPFGKRVLAFKHNDVVSLERRLKQAKGRPVIMFESIYSADGSIAPVRKIVELARKYDALTFVDDANGYLVYGRSDLPFAEEFQALEDVTFHMISLSKSVGLEGGAIAGPREYVEALEWLSGTSSFTATILPPAASAATHAIELIEGKPEILTDFHERVKRFRGSLTEAGFTLNPSPAYITTVHIGSEAAAEQIRDKALQAGYLVPIFRYPAVPKGHAGLRLMPNVEHTDEQIADLVDTLVELREEVGF